MVYFLCKINFNKSLYPRTFTYDAEPPNLVESLVFCKDGSSVLHALWKHWFQLLQKNLDFIYLTNINLLILISCFCLLKKTLVITTNLTNPESASVFPEKLNLTYYFNIIFNISDVLAWFSPAKNSLYWVQEGKMTCSVQVFATCK